MKRAEAYEPFYQFLKEPSDSEKWKALRGLVDNLVAETERDTIDKGLEIIDKEIQLAKDCQISTVTLWRVRQDILDLKRDEQE